MRIRVVAELSHNDINITGDDTFLLGRLYVGLE